MVNEYLSELIEDMKDKDQRDKWRNACASLDLSLLINK